MPTYVYACRQCEERVEVFQRITEDPLTTCEKCGGELRRVLFPAAVVYKGSGFYTTDYKNGGRTSEKSTESGSSSNGASKSEGDAKKEPAATSS